MPDVGIAPVFWIVPNCGSIIYPEAIVTSFCYLVSYRAHRGAIVAVFLIGLSVAQGKGGHETMAHRKALAVHKSSIGVVNVQVCEKNEFGGCEHRCHRCPRLHCRTAQIAPHDSSPLVEASKFCSVIHPRFPDLYSFFSHMFPVAGTVLSYGHTLPSVVLAVVPKGKILAWARCAFLQVPLPSELFKSVISLCP